MTWFLLNDSLFSGFYDPTHHKNRARSSDCYAVNNVSNEGPASVDQEQHLHWELPSVGTRVHSNSIHPSEEENQRLLQEVWVVVSQILNTRLGLKCGRYCSLPSTIYRDVISCLNPTSSLPLLTTLCFFDKASCANLLPFRTKRESNHCLRFVSCWTW